MATLEERIAALEAMLAALGTPDDYYVSRYSGEEIDDLLGKANAAIRYDAAQSLTAAQQHTAQKNIGTTWPCNPNLLDNWYFGNPVNQRGQTSYTGEIYGIDRWKGRWTGDGTATITGNGLKLFRAGHPAHNLQNIEHPERLAGQVVTLSILAKNGYSAIVINGAEQTFNGITSLGVKSNTITLPDPLTSLAVEVLSAADETDNLFLAVKLELGDTQTLAHKEGDTWVLNEIPDYGEQLRRCQRYFVRLRQYAQARATQIVQDYIDFSVVVPEAMRACPVITGGTAYVDRITSASVDGFSFAVAAQSANNIRLRASKTGHGLTDATLEVSDYLDLSADL